MNLSTFRLGWPDQNKPSQVYAVCTAKVGEDPVSGARTSRTLWISCQYTSVPCTWMYVLFEIGHLSNVKNRFVKDSYNRSIMLHSHMSADTAEEHQHFAGGAEKAWCRVWQVSHCHGWSWAEWLQSSAPWLFTCCILTHGSYYSSFRVMSVSCVLIQLTSYKVR